MAGMALLARRFGGVLALLCALPTVSLAERLSPFPAAAGAEKLPATQYNIDQGLANSNVYRILPDSRGFIWFATREGLSRFDGYTFTNYGEAHGLPSAVIHDLLETHDGVYLVATAGGLARLESRARRRPNGDHVESAGAIFSVHQVSSDPRARYVTALYEDRNRTVWVGTRVGLFAMENPAGDMKFRRVIPDPRQDDPRVYVWSIREDRFGTVWIATATGLRRLWPDGRVDTHFPEYGVHSVLADRAGHLWAGTRLTGLLKLTFDDRTGQLAASRRFTMADGLPHNWINQLLEVGDGELWAGCPGGLIQITGTASDHPRMRLFSEAHGIGRGEFHTVAVDRSGNLWAGGLHSGAVKIARSGLSGFSAADGLRWAISALQTRSGDVCVVGPATQTWGLYCFNGLSFDVIHPRLKGLSWGWNQIAIEDHTGEWWFATREGVARFEKTTRPHDLNGRSPKIWYRTRDGLTNDVILRLFEDSRRDIWISAVGEGGPNGLSRWHRRTNTFEHFRNQANLPDLNVYFATAFEEDGSGNVWIGFSGDGGVARHRNGAFDALNTRGLFSAAVRNLFRDSIGRIWVPSYRGLVRVDEPAAAAPAFVAYTTANGLSSNEATAIVEDREGRLYIGTARGIDRLDPASGRFKRYSTRDGLASGEIGSAVLDRRNGHLWFAQQFGASRLIPPADPAPVPPPILITALEVAGEPRSLDPLGETTLAKLQLESRRNQLRIEYVALGFGPGEDLRYQYRLDGGLDEWSAPSNQRSVNFANLAPGSYRFMVRAISADGTTSLEPASLQFALAPPMWQRWWFLTLATAGAALAVYAAYRYRLQRAIEIATVRTRIATDLHDDIGADLTKIAILSEVARQQLGGIGEAGYRLSTIARISRESVASMSDVVWAINPKRDTLRDTIRRMRQHAEEVLAGRGVALEFYAPDGEYFRVPMDVRRELFLVFKEALNNAVRHSRCRKLVIDVRADASALDFRLSDDGVGFDTAADPAGNGLTSMRRRAARMNASLDVISTPGHGTTVLVSLRGSFAGRLRRPA